MQKVSFGTVLHEPPIPRFSFKAENQTIIFVGTTPDLLAIAYHFFEGVGRVTCIEGVCCDVDGQKPPVRYVLPGFVIEEDGPVVDLSKAQGRVRCLLLSGRSYENLLDAVGKGGSIVGSAFRVTCTSLEYQSLNFEKIEGTLPKKILDQAAGFILENLDSIPSQFSRTFTEEQLVEKLGVEAPGSVIGKEQAAGLDLDS